MNKKSNKKIIRSAKLRKYATVYKSFIRKVEESKIDKSPPRPRRKKGENNKTSKKKRNDSNTVVSKRKILNKYQKFVKDESKKEKYKKLPGKERLSAIASEWKKTHK